MILTPTYHVFEMYKRHQGAIQLPVELACNAYALGIETIPGIKDMIAKFK